MLSVQQEELLEKLRNPQFYVAAREQETIDIMCEQSQKFKAAVGAAREARRTASLSAPLLAGAPQDYSAQDLDYAYKPSVGKPRQSRRSAFAAFKPKVPSIIDIDEQYGRSSDAYPPLNGSYGAYQAEVTETAEIAKPAEVKSPAVRFEATYRCNSYQETFASSFNQNVMQNLRGVYSAQSGAVYQSLLDEQRRANALLQRQAEEQERLNYYTELKEKQAITEKRRLLRLQVIQQRYELEELRREKQSLEAAQRYQQAPFGTNAEGLKDNYYDYLQMRFANRRRFAGLEVLDEEFGDERENLD